MVEADHRIPRDLDVLALVVADGDVLSVVEDDVGGLQRRIREEPGGDEEVLALGRLLLELRHP